MVYMRLSRLRNGRPARPGGVVHRGGAEKRRGCEVGEKATERDFISRSGPNAEAAGVYVGATLPSRCGSRSRARALEKERA
jgi:hypothetical protein